MYRLERAMDTAEAELRQLGSVPFSSDEAMREIERELGEMRRELGEMQRDLEYLYQREGDYYR